MEKKDKPRPLSPIEKKLNELNNIINKYDLKISLDDFRIKRREFLDLIPS